LIGVVAPREIAAGVEPAQRNGKAAELAGGLAHDVSPLGRHIGIEQFAEQIIQQRLGFRRIHSFLLDFRSIVRSRRVLALLTSRAHLKRLRRHTDACRAPANPRLRTTMIQLAWLWLRHQPRSALTLWFQDRINRNGGRRRKTTIVALARKLLVALWKYVSAGVVIEGAMIRPA